MAASNNGVAPEPSGEELRTAQLLDEADLSGADAPPTPESSDDTIERDPGDGPGAHDVPRITGLVDDALHRGAEHLNDPEAMRPNAVDVGRRLHPVEPKYLFDGGLVDRLFDDLGEIREGAELRPALEEGAQLATVVETAETNTQLEVAGGQAAVQAASRLVKDLPQLERDVEDAKEPERAAEANVETQEEAFEAALDDYQEQQAASAVDDTIVDPVHKRREAREKAAKRRSVFELIRISPKAFAIAVLAELFATTFLLSGPISDLVSVSYSWEPYLIAAAISAALTGLGIVAGYAAAAVRLPARVAGVVIVALAVAMLLNASDLLTPLRLGDERGVGLLSLATMATVVIAAVTSYSATVYEAHKRAAVGEPEERDVLDRLDVPFAVPHPLNVAARRLARAKQSLVEARDERVRREDLLAAKKAEIADLWKVVEQTPRRALAAEKIGLEARVALDGLLKRTMVVLGQERANVDACKAAAELGHRLVRAEERPEPVAEPVAIAADEPAQARRRLSALHKAALSVLGLGAVLTVLLPTVWIAVAALVTAAAVWLLAERRRRHAAVGAQPGPNVRRPSIEPLADSDNPTWHELPSFSVPKWRRRDTAPTERS